MADVYAILTAMQQEALRALSDAKREHQRCLDDVNRAVKRCDETSRQMEELEKALAVAAQKLASAMESHYLNPLIYQLVGASV